ncbi:renal tumor antigen [Marchantia polymorpha subsp. ruderalis]|uniref:Protein kinase domain-containing protein n=1 Tax=Marchantia polymorpha TaxID=3197 RepID=A0A2R6W443_MARPO|nr:hypothetical protein MARPO_0158s0009 [Marchantia polymorpha]BBN01677.1 hypothetical protein Mp_2g09380 [Marchantia polymorpha subsp. ruderalis]|eukprot:PTQ28628.1 hypothetical protein MARPO_0158s0009 [Marchantia polymorpha]
MHKYRMLAKKGEGTFSEVLKAQCIRTSKYVAIKCMKNNFESIEQVTSLREIQALQRLSPHANVIKLLEVLYDQPTGRLALVFELMDMNIYELIRGRRNYVAEDRIKGFMYQLMKAMDHMHRNGIFHRDIKPENILIMEDTLKLADFGSCRGVYSKQPYTEYISTRWYRAPECLLTDGYYNYKMDMWGVGCVFFEIISLFPLFPGNNELDQIQKIHKILGTPPAQLLEKMKRRSQHADFKFPQQDGTGIGRLIPHASPACVELLNRLLAYNPDDRLSARQALRHIYFKELREKDKLQQAFLNANRSNSLKPSPRSSPRLTTQDLGQNKQRGNDLLRPSVTEKNSCFTNISANSTPQSITSLSQLPVINGNGKVKEDDKDTMVHDGAYTPASHVGDVQSPATLTSVGSAVSVFMAPDAGTTERNSDEMGVDFAPALPPIRNSYNQSVLSPKIPASHAPSVQRPLPPRLHTPKAQSLKGVKVMKGTKSHRTLPELSPKSTMSAYKPGEPPPYKKRANNSKGKEAIYQQQRREDRESKLIKGKNMDAQAFAAPGISFPHCTTSSGYFGSGGRPVPPDHKYQKTLIY